MTIVLPAALLLLVPGLRAAPIPAQPPRDALEARALLGSLTALEAHHEDAAAQMTELLAEYRHLGGDPGSGLPPDELLRRREEVWTRYGRLIERANELCDEGKAAIDAVNVSAVMAAMTGTGSAWVAAAVRELPRHSDRHSVLCRRNDSLIRGFTEEQRLNDPLLAAAVTRAQRVRAAAVLAAGAVALLTLAALFLKRRRIP